MTRIDRSLVIVVLVLAVTCAQAQQPPIGKRMRIPPQDETARAPGFREFIERFRKALEQRDVAMLLSMVDARIVSDPFGDQLIGHQAFRNYHHLDDRGSEFWRTVSDTLGLGAAVEGCDNPQGQCLVTVPYWTDRTPNLDSFDHFIARRENVPMYSAPRVDATIVERLSYDVVNSVEEFSQQPIEGWQEVSLPDGRRGFVREGDLYRKSWLRMWFVRKDGGLWVLSGLVGGD